MCIRDRFYNNKALNQQLYQAETIQFDELQTIEHTKCKPLAVAVAVTEKHVKFWRLLSRVCLRLGI